MDDFEVAFEILPAYRRKISLIVRKHGLAAAVAIVGEQESRLVDAVNVTLCRNLILDAGQGEGGVEQIHEIEKAVADASRLDHARPISNGRHADAAFPSRPLTGTEGREAGVRVGVFLGTVVGCEENQGVVGLPGFFEGLS